MYAISSQIIQKLSLQTILYFFTIVTVIGITFSVAVSSIAMSAAIVLGIWYLASNKIALPKTGIEIFFLAYIVAELLASIFSHEPLASFTNMKRLLIITVVYLILLTFNTTERLKIGVIVFLAVSSLLSFIELFFLKTDFGGLQRLSVFQYYLTEGGLKMMTLLLLLPFIFNQAVPFKWKIFCAAAVFPLISGLVLTQTRSSWLGFIAGIVTIGLIKSKKALLLLVVLVLVFIFFAPSDLKTRATSIFDPSYTSNKARIAMLTTGWKMFLDRPIVGFGDVDLKKYYVTYTTPIEQGEGGHLHNNFMHLLVTLGIVGFTAVIALFVAIFYHLYNAVQATTGDWFLGSISVGAMAAYIGFHVNGLFEWNFGDHEIAVLFWFIIGIALSSQRLIAQRTIELHKR